MPCINLFFTIKTKGILLKGIFIPKLLNNPLASCCLRNFDVLLSHITQFDKSIIYLFFVLATFGFLLSVFNFTLQTII